MGTRERIIKKLENVRDEHTLDEMEKWIDAMTGSEQEEFTEKDIKESMEGGPTYKSSSPPRQEGPLFSDGVEKAGRRKEED